uniref:Uncharacterized protein n=1 Tax=Noctiluca scintillans TaxID=2966 RepID=A0A7S1B2S7_NOCSC|mmetsp:Transcript_9786/g.27321  ORF Transcript_9786/g.27321 Transcript_9786/m.27321 type:complete len:121 (+) Transcript_9786:92-454(+)
MTRAFQKVRALFRFTKISRGDDRTEAGTPAEEADEECEDDRTTSEQVRDAIRVFMAELQRARRLDRDAAREASRTSPALQSTPTSRNYDLSTALTADGPCRQGLGASPPQTQEATRRWRL